MIRFKDCRNDGDRDYLGSCAAGIAECYDACPFYLKPVTKKLHGLTFGEALQVLKTGGRVRRSGWNGAGMWLQAQFPDEHSKMTHPYIYIEYPAGINVNYPTGSRIPWLASQTDIFGEDWSIVE